MNTIITKMVFLTRKWSHYWGRKIQDFVNIARGSNLTIIFKFTLFIYCNGEEYTRPNNKRYRITDRKGLITSFCESMKNRLIKRTI